MISFSSTPMPKPPMLQIKRFGGVDFGEPTQIDLSRSPEMWNMQLDAKGTLEQRTGYEKAYPNSLGSSKINGLFYNKQIDKFVIAYEDKLYTFTLGQDPTLLYTGIANAKVRSFFMGGKQYFLDGANYLVFDGTTVTSVEDNAYIPTLTLSRNPSGGGTPYEQVNLLSPGFKDSFSGDGSSTTYQLSLKGLDATTVTAKVDGVDKTEGTDFTVDRTTGVVTWTSAPATGTNNVIITAYKTQSGFADRIKKCTIYALFGGENDTRVFVSGNIDSPNMDWRSGLYDPTYFPENGYTKIGSDYEAIKGYSIQYDTLVIHKENSKWNRGFELTDGTATFPLKPVNNEVGLIGDTLQTINNNPTGLTWKGVYALVGGAVRDERNVQHISERVDELLLEEADLKRAVSFDYDNKYGICVNNKVYILDYEQNEWYTWNNIPASCFVEHDRYLYFGSNGMVYRFKKDHDTKPYNDDGQAINAVWKSKVMAMDAEEYKKFVEKVHFTLKPIYNRVSADFSYISDKKRSGVLKTVRLDTFDWTDIDFSQFSFIISTLPQPGVVKTKAKKIIYFQIILENNRLDDALAVASIGINYDLQSEVK